MSGIDREQVRRVARLARLELSTDEVERLAGDLERVLSRFRELEAAEAADGEEAGEEAGGDGDAAAGPSPEAPEDADSALRPDRPDADPLARQPGEMAPEWENGFFLVPRLPALGEAAGDGDEGGA